MKRETITIGQLPENATFAVNSNAIIVTLSHENTYYWLAPEAIMSTDGQAVAKGRLVNGVVEVTEFEPPTKQICIWMDEEDKDSWNIRMLPVNFAPTLPEFIGPMETYTDTMEDEAAGISEVHSRAGMFPDKIGDLELWWGQKPADGHLPLQPTRYMRTRFEIGVRIARIGDPTPFNLDLPLSDKGRVIAGAHMRMLLSGPLSRVDREKEPERFMETFHSIVALYSIMIRAGLILPRQYDKELFDNTTAFARTMGQDWSVDLRRMIQVLGFDWMTTDPAMQWTEEDIVFTFSAEDTKRLAHLSHFTSEPDGIYTAFIVKVSDPDRITLPIEDIQLELANHGVFVDLSHLDENEKYTWAIQTEWANSAFRNYFREQGEDRFSDVEGDDWEPPELV